MPLLGSFSVSKNATDASPAPFPTLSRKQAGETGRGQELSRAAFRSSATVKFTFIIYLARSFANFCKFFCKNLPHPLDK